MDLDDSNKGNVTNTIEDEENSQTGLLINYNQIHIPKQYDQFGKHMLRK
jgi:hypothetical protein